MAEFYCQHLFTGTAWLQDATVRCDLDGMVTAVTPNDRSRWPATAKPIAIALPGFVNSHSHGFQALFAGLAERRLSPDDDFWSWRQLMYQSAAALSRADILPVYRHLYRQMLAAGYTHVCEFHYLHHRPDGKPYEPATALADAVRDAAAEVGIGLTLLPVWYRYSQFGRVATHDGQRRFYMGLEAWRDYLHALAEVADTGMYRLGIAAHSLRAVAAEDIGLMIAPLAGRPGPLPLHIHIAEQRKEVADCVAATGKRPIELFMAALAELAGPDNTPPPWSLVHATHATAKELDQMVAAKAVAVLCPSTEANLGDGAFAYQSFLSQGGRIALGSDSHVGLMPFAELQLMEYTARLAAMRRSVLASGEQNSPATRLLAAVAASAPATSGLPLGQLAAGFRADIIGFDPAACDLPLEGGGPAAHEAFLDYLLVHRPYTPPQTVIVAGKARPAPGASCPDRQSFLNLRSRLLAAASQAPQN